MMNKLLRGSRQSGDFWHWGNDAGTWSCGLGNIHENAHFPHTYEKAHLRSTVDCLLATVERKRHLETDVITIVTFSPLPATGQTPPPNLLRVRGQLELKPRILHSSGKVTKSGPFPYPRWSVSCTHGKIGCNFKFCFNLLALKERTRIIALLRGRETCKIHYWRSELEAELTDHFLQA